MIENPRVTIVTPSFNHRAFLEDTIRSVLTQDYPNIEYIIMDGGSTDGSVEVIQRYAGRLAYYESQPDLGQAHAINKGLLRSRGEILGWLNSDDVLLPSTVGKVVEVFSRFSEVDVIYGRLERVDKDGRVIPTPLLPKDRVEFSQEFVVGECLVNQPGSFWKRSIMEKAGMLDERLAYCMDYEYWIRLALAGARFKRLSDVVARFRLSETSKTVNQAENIAQEQLDVLTDLLARRDLLERLDISEQQLQKKARKARANISLHVFYGYWKSHRRNAALDWLFRALRHDPWVLFQRKWLDLLGASLARRFSIHEENPEK